MDLPGDEHRAIHRVQHLNRNLGIFIKPSRPQPVRDQGLGRPHRQALEWDAADEGQMNVPVRAQADRLRVILHEYMHQDQVSRV